VGQPDGVGGLAASYAMLWPLGWAWGSVRRCAARGRQVGSKTLVPPERRARAMAGFMMAVRVGGMLSFAIGGPVAQAFDGV